MFTSQQSTGVSDYQDLSKLIQEKTFDKLVENVNIEKRFKIIDIGCGTGNNSYKLSKLIGNEGKVVATDPIKERIEKSKELYNSPNLHFEVAFGSECPKFGIDFDLAVSSTVLHWIPPDQKLPTFKGIFDSLGNGSEFVFNTLKLNTLNLSPISSKLSSSSSTMSNYHPSTQAELESLARQAGFNQVDIKEVEVIIPLPSVDHYYRWYACSVHVENYDAVLKEFRDLKNTNEELACLHDDKGQVIYKHTYFYGYCRK